MFIFDLKFCRINLLKSHLIFIIYFSFVIRSILRIVIFVSNTFLFIIIHIITGTAEPESNVIIIFQQPSCWKKLFIFFYYLSYWSHIKIPLFFFPFIQLMGILFISYYSSPLGKTPLINFFPTVSLRHPLSLLVNRLCTQACITL